MAFSGIHVPRPCPASRQALTPTEAGWHCARCHTEVVDFTRLTDAEVLAYLAARAGQRVCAQVASLAVAPPHPKRAKGARRWLLAALALGGGTGPLLAHGALPPLPPALHEPLLLKGWRTGRVVVRGTVLDDSLGVPVPGAYVFIADTKYGAITNEQGEFSFSIAASSKLAASGQLVLRVSGSAFVFQTETLSVHLSDRQPPTPLLVRLRSVPDRGYVRGKVRFIAPPVAPPGSSRK